MLCWEQFTACLSRQVCAVGLLCVLPHRPAVVRPDVGAPEIVGVPWNKPAVNTWVSGQLLPSGHKEENSLPGRTLSYFFASVTWNVCLPNEKLFFCSWASTWLFCFLCEECKAVTGNQSPQVASFPQERMIFNSKNKNNG